MPAPAITFSKAEVPKPRPDRVERRILEADELEGSIQCKRGGPAAQGDTRERAAARVVAIFARDKRHTSRPGHRDRVEQAGEHIGVLAAIGLVRDADAAQDRDHAVGLAGHIRKH